MAGFMRAPLAHVALLVAVIAHDVAEAIPRSFFFFGFGFITVRGRPPPCFFVTGASPTLAPDPSVLTFTFSTFCPSWYLPCSIRA
eukprot:CAMPEP_0113296170 /NCGR_PEP_ID=MMETSP0008_2-20120614/36855_1 /TAXON_ID=97485 /ORGANISM="Prymnesium parvum" /LENGTH=84 /DNA_ID=CAMNT_0000148963 /DNA_START=223 /DNA_END=478 /DNA_ORIENTATION=+ /assembly_acc=CAM_ASM_000153